MEMNFKESGRKENYMAMIRIFGMICLLMKGSLQRGKEPEVEIFIMKMERNIQGKGSGKMI